MLASQIKIALVTQKCIIELNQLTTFQLFNVFFVPFQCLILKFSFYQQLLFNIIFDKLVFTIKIIFIKLLYLQKYLKASLNKNQDE